MKKSFTPDYESKEYTDMKIQKDDMLSKPNKPSINVRCTYKEYAQITDKANSYGMSISEYVRFTALNAKITVKATK